MGLRLLLAMALAAAIAVVGCKKKEHATDPLRVAAAADLAFAFPEIASKFEAKTGQKVIFSFGSTGLLARQIAEGAPFDVFAAASTSFVDEVVKEGACDASTKTLYARGRIVVFTAKDRPAPAAISGLDNAQFAKIAIANPDHAPYGKAAKQVLEHEGLWAKLEPKIVYGENVQQTLKFAQSGNAEVAIVALSLAMVSEGNYVPIDPSLHAPIDQALVVCKGRSTHRDVAIDFANFVNSEDGRRIMRRYGFLLPSEAAGAPAK